MSSPRLLERLKEHSLSIGYTLVAEDFAGGEVFLPPDLFVVRDASGDTYSVSVELLSSDG